MRVSSNELKSLFKNAFRGAGMAPGQYKAAADCFVWLQMHGFSGFELFERQLASDTAFQIGNFEIVAESRSRIDVTISHSSLALSAELISGLCQANAQDNGDCLCIVEGAREQTSILHKISELSVCNLAAYAVWPISENMARLAKLNKSGGIDLSDYSVSDTKLASLTLLYGADRQLLRRRLLKCCAFIDGPSESFYSASEAQAFYQSSLTEGIEISESLCQRLINFGSQALVESSVQSRRGAGA
ncbi:MAG: hypothetical protein ACI9FR_001730 [Cryomorphaceae bacterium]